MRHVWRVGIGMPRHVRSSYEDIQGVNQIVKKAMRAPKNIDLGRTAAPRRATPAVARRRTCVVRLRRSGFNRATRHGDLCSSLHLLGVRGAAAAAAAARCVHELRGLRRWLGGLQRCSAIRATPSAATGAVMQAYAAAGCLALHAPRLRHVLSTHGRSRQTRTTGCRWAARRPGRVV